MKKLSLKGSIPYLVAIVLFAAIAMVYFYPVLKGYKIKQGDISQHKGMSHELRSHREKFNEEPLWIGNMFSGMPAYQVSNVRYSGDVMPLLKEITQLGLPHPIGILFAYMIGFFIFALCLRINPWLALIGGIAYGFSSYFIIIIEAGHNTKALAIAYLPPLIGGIIATLRGRVLVGFLVTVIFLALELYSNHLQITYYGIFLILGIGIVELIDQLKKNEFNQFLRRVGLLIIAAIVGILPNIGNLITTYEYSKASTRSPSELTITPDGQKNTEVKSSGLDKDYITNWSYGIEETFSLFLPKVKGGASGAILGDEEEIERLRKENPSFFNFLVQEYQENQNVINTYWGNQPFTSGSVYVGVIIFFLAYLALFFVRDRLILAFGVVTILVILLSWGKNFMPFTEFFIDYIPLYDKFRAVSMILVIAEFTLPVFAILFLSKLYRSREELMQEKKKLLLVSGSFLGILLLFWLLPDAFFTFLSQNEKASFDVLRKSNPNVLTNIQLLEEYRIELFREDLLRSLQFLILAMIVIGLYLMSKIKRNLALTGIAVLVFIDLWSIDKQYINNEVNPKARINSSNRFLSYEKPLDKKAPYAANPVDQAILQKELSENPSILEEINQEVNKKKLEKPRLSQKEIEHIQYMELMRGTHYRVLNTTKKLDNDAQTAYFHKTLGGYHGAKMKKYQELVDFELGEEHFQLRQAFLQGGSSQVNSMLPKMNVTNMLNAKYIIGAVNTQQGQRLTYLENPNALGNAWFVESYKLVSNADEEILALKDLDPAKEAVVRKEYSNLLSQKSYPISPSSKIELKSYLPNQLVYGFNTTQKQFVVFSEIFYDKGWRAYLDGNEIPYFKVNYILRGIELPAGQGELVFKFEPATYAIAEKLTWVSSILILLVIGVTGVTIYKRVKTKE